MPQAGTAERPSETPRLWLIYYPRACHHLFMRMFAEHTGLEILEVLTHMRPAVPQTLEISALINLDGSTETVDECGALQSLNLECWRKWIADIEQLELQGKRLMNSTSIPFQVSPAAQNWWLHHQQHQSVPSNGYDMEQSETSKSHLFPTCASALSSSPTSLAYWRLPLPGHPADLSDDNPTVYTKTFLLSQQPILLIRHPIRAFPSTVRLASQYFGSAMGAKFMNLVLRYRWHRIIYDWYSAQSSPLIPQNERAFAPLVLDADELMYNRNAVAELCRRTGLKPEETVYEWATSTASDMKVTYENEQVFLDTLANSSGVVPGQGSEGLEIETELPKWKEEFGEERAERIKQLVQEATDDYEYLKARSVGKL